MLATPCCCGLAKKGLTQGEALSVCFSFSLSLVVSLIGLWPRSVMSSADVDTQHRWAEDVLHDVSVESLDDSVPPPYA